MLATFSRSICAAVTLVALAAPVADASWPHVDPNGNVPVCTISGPQTPQPIVSDGVGGAIFAWSDQRIGENNTDVYAQRVSADGTVLWATAGVPVCTMTGSQFVVTNGVVSDGAGGAVIVFTGGPGSISAQRIDGSGNALWAPNGVAVGTATSNQPPVACSDGAGGAIFAWIDGSNFVVAQRVLPNGTKAWGPNPVPVCTTGGSGVVIAPDGAQGAYVGWTIAAGIFLQRVNAAGAPQWAANGLGVTGPTNYNDEMIAADGAGGVLLARRGNSGSLLASRFSSTGATLWGEITLSTDPNPGFFKMSGAGAAGADFCWVDTSVEPYVLRAQRMSAAGIAQWASGGVAVSVAPYQRYLPTIARDASENLFVSWQDNRGFYDIYVQKLDPSGVPQWTAQGVPVCTSGGAQQNQSFVFDDRGGLIMGWRDKRANNEPDIYAQRVDGFGYLGNPEPAITSVTDVPNDHGGMVDVSWTPSWLDPPGGTIVDYQVSRLDADWVPVGTLPATGASSYSLAVPTTVDSSAAGTGLTTFRVQARTSGAPFWNSATATGHSVDDLGTVGVPTGAGTRLSLEAPLPNPARSATTIRWSLAHAGAARLAVFDPAGRLARVLYHADASAGPHATSFTWEAGALPAGLYLVSLEAEGARLVRRMAIVR